MKKLMIVLALMLVPTMAFAGMTICSDDQMEEISGQAGIDLTMDLTTSISGFAWSDTDGYGAATNATGSLVMSGLTLPSISISSLTIDAGTNGGTSVLRLDFGGGTIMSGNLVVQDIVIGSASNATTASVGRIDITGLSVTAGVVTVSGH